MGFVKDDEVEQRLALRSCLNGAGGFPESAGVIIVGERADAKDMWVLACYHGNGLQYEVE